MKQTVTFSLLLLLLGLLAACRVEPPTPGVATPPPAVDTPIASAPSPTATVAAATPTLQPTPETGAPTATPTVEPAAGPTSTATTPPPTATAGPANERISFAAGASSAIVEGVVHAGQEARYTLRVQQGQSIQLRLSSLEDSATMQILDPAGNTLNPGGGGPGSTFQVTQWAGPAPATGDYQIVVTSLQGSATYRLEVYIPPLSTGGDPTATERVQFEPGMSGITLSGSLPQGLGKSYVLRALQDQWLSVSVYAPANNPFLTISGEDGTVFVRDVLGQTSWYIPALPRTQDYTITVVAANGPADYILNIGLNALSDQPARIEFAAGSNSATLIDRLAAGGDAEYYIFRALAGQTVTVSGMPAGSPLFIYLQAADGSSFFGGDVSLQATLPASGDYVLTVGSPNAAGTVDYNLTLTIE
jgi:hypothetical protein